MNDNDGKPFKYGLKLHSRGIAEGKRTRVEYSLIEPDGRLIATFAPDVDQHEAQTVADIGEHFWEIEKLEQQLADAQSGPSQEDYDKLETERDKLTKSLEEFHNSGEAKARSELVTLKADHEKVLADKSELAQQNKSLSDERAKLLLEVQSQRDTATTLRKLVNQLETKVSAVMAANHTLRNQVHELQNEKRDREEQPARITMDDPMFC